MYTAGAPVLDEVRVMWLEEGWRGYAWLEMESQGETKGVLVEVEIASQWSGSMVSILPPFEVVLVFGAESLFEEESLFDAESSFNTEPLRELEPLFDPDVECRFDAA